MKKNFLVAICSFLSLSVTAQVNNWIGSVSSDYFNKYNWSDTLINFTALTSSTLQIGAGSPNNCILVGGNSSNVNYRPARINTLTGGIFTCNGAVYPNNNDSINGTLVLNAPADLNIRNILYVGNKTSGTVIINGGKLSTKNGAVMASGTGGAATVTMYGGSFNVGGGGVNMDLTMANVAGQTAQLSLLGGGCIIARNLVIGAGGNIHITGIGFLKVAGDKTAQLNNLIGDGRLSCTTGKTLAVVYDGTNTTASIPQDANSMITEYPDSVVLKTANLICVIEKTSGNIVSYRYKGVETVANKAADAHKYMYHDFTTSYGFETIFGATYEVVQDDSNFAHIVIKRPYTPAIGHVTPCDAELHYALKKNDKGVYVYSKLEHKPSYPHFDIGSWRQVWWIASTNGINLCERIYTDSLRSWEMPSNYDYSTATGSGGPQEIVNLTTGVRAGKFDGKYEYSLKFWDNPVWGQASNINNIGSWCINASCEYFNEGPMHHDLNAAAGIIHQCMNGVHYGDGGIFADTLTSWTKVFGPYMLLITDKPTGDQNWAEAKARQVQETSQWPYAWVKDSAAYPPASLRGSVIGSYVIQDALKPAFNGGGAWIGLTDLSDGATNFQFESRNYQYWVKTSVEGSFTIPNVRPGTYSLFAFVDGAVGEYRLDNVTVTAGGNTNLGTLSRTIDRSFGNLIFEIGKPDRTSAEFKLGDFDYCEGNIQNKFRDTFPNPIEYNVADNNWADKLGYAHTKYPTTDAIPNPGDAWKWRLNFVLPAGIPTTGNARLTIAYASNDHAQQWIYINNEASSPTAFYPANGDGNAFIRQANFAKYTYNTILIPMNKLVVGNNTITLVMPSNSGWVSHLMYDYISLEAIVGALPVTLLAFDAKATNDKKVQLSWRTATESNNSHFEIEQSTDGRSFTTIGRVTAAPNATNGSSYLFTHSTPADGINYYRLKQVDNDGKFVYSVTKQVNFILKKLITIYPNPVMNTLFVATSSANNLREVSLYDALGKLLQTKANIAAKQCSFNMTGLAKGSYFVKVNDGVSTVVEKLTKD
ncbi:MAG: polysaccharide lyase family protein [Chitinophagaceae bacterium]